MPDREKVVDGLERLRFFNQRAGRELWSAKPHDVQEIDISDADAVFADALELLESDETLIENLARAINDLGEKLRSQPQIVRCKDCKKRNQHKECEYGYHSDGWFCADGEKEDG